MFRHTYATRLVIDFADKGNVDLDPNNKASIEFIHQYLQEQLGHLHRSTTVKYMRTALRVVKRRWIPKVPLSSNVETPGRNQNASFSQVVDFKGLLRGTGRLIYTPKECKHPYRRSFIFVASSALLTISAGPKMYYSLILSSPIFIDPITHIYSFLSTITSASSIGSLTAFRSHNGSNPLSDFASTTTRILPALSARLAMAFQTSKS